MQYTISFPVSFSGVGVHSGAPVQVVLHPAPAGSGIVFVRTDRGGSVIPALWDHVTDTRLCTVLENEDGISVSTVEHLMAALHGCGIDNARIEIDGPEMPIMDGSAIPFVEAIEEAGRTKQDAPRQYIRVLKEIEITDGDKWVRLSPGNIASFSGAIEFDHPLIGRQERSVAMLNGNFRHDIADSRTFGFLHEVEALRAAGLARGGSLDNVIVLDEDKVLNPDGLRHKDEFIRHKLLDAVGDLYLAGMSILGTYESFKPGHALNNQVLQALFADREAWIVEPKLAKEKDTAKHSQQKEHAITAGDFV